ncbi:unnamed protein product, partial [Rotaria sp. Silwood1]
QRGLNNSENIILAAFNRAKELVSNLNILPSLKKCNACELNGLSKNIFDSIRFNINSDTYSATDADSSSDSESDYDDETMESNEFNSDLINVDEEDKDAATTQSVDEITTEKINFTGMRIFDSINRIGVKRSKVKTSKVKISKRQNIEEAKYRKEKSRMA